MSAKTLQASRLRAELYPVTRDLLADGFTVYYLEDPNPVRLINWLIFGKADDTGKVNTGTVSYDRIDGLHVNASIKPSHNYGSAVAFWDERDSQGPNDYATILEACQAAAKPTVQIRYIKGAPRVPNHGIEHFDWCSDRLVNVTA